MRIIDLSATIAPSRPDALPFERVEIRSSSHAEGAAQVEAMLHVPPSLLRDGEGWAVEEFTRLATHSVTTSTHPGTTTASSRGRGPPPSTSCRWSGSSPTAWSST
jgi:hypothetical protein